MNKIKIIITALCIVGLSLASFVHAAELSDAEQNTIRKQLYVMDDFSGLTSEQVAQYKKIMYQHIVKLEDKIEEGNRLLSLDVAKGLSLSGLFGVFSYVFWKKKLDRNHKFVGVFDEHGYSKADSRINSYINTVKSMDIENQLSLLCSVFATKLAYDYLRKAYNAKDRAKNRLLRDKGILYQLEKVA